LLLRHAIRKQTITTAAFTYGKYAWNKRFAALQVSGVRLKARTHG